MPEDQRTSATDHLSRASSRSDGALALLEAGDLEVEGRMPWSSNATLLVTVRLGGAETKAVYKPGAGERGLWDFPDGLYRREVAAYELSASVGLDVVPVTVLRAEGPYGAGSLQRFVDADFAQHYFTLLEMPDHLGALRRVAGFDVLANNADRKGGHLLLDADGHVWGIDNGLCFHPDPKLRTVMWDFAGDELPGEVLAACEQMVGSVPERLVPLLSPAELAGLVSRARSMLDEPRFPEPDDDRHCYPWPLV